MRSRRAIAKENRELSTRLDQCQALLAAIAIENGGRITVGGAAMDDVAKDADIRTFALRVLSNGDMRVDFEAPEVEMTVIEEAPCSST